MQHSEKNDVSTGSLPSQGVVIALRRVLFPLVRLMLAQGITYPYVAELLKGLFVEVTNEEFRMDAKIPTDSRVSLVSGVHRKDVKRLKQDIAAGTEIIPATVSLGTRLVSIWTNLPQYLDENNRPKPLSRFIREGGEISFEGLVGSVSSDIRSRVVLDEWLRLGIVYFDDQQRVCLNNEAFIPAKGFNEKAFYFGHNVHDHTAAAVHNLLGSGQPFFERSVHYDALSTGSVSLLAKRSKELGMQTLLAINKDAMELEKNDALDNGKPKQRMTLGIYFFSESVPPEETDVKGSTTEGSV